MKRSLTLLLIVVVIVARGIIAEAQQQPTKIPRIAYLIGSYLSTMTARTEAFRQGLRELGYVEGKTLSSSGDLPMENPIAYPGSRLSWCVSRWT